MANEPDRDYSERIEKKFRDLEQRIQQDVVRRLHQAGEITSTADWQLNRLYVLGNSTADIEKIIKEAVGDTYPDVFELYDKVLSQQYVRTEALYEQINEEATPYNKNPEMRQLVDGLIRASNDQLRNITGSMGFMLDYGNGRMVFTPLAEIYKGYIDQAMLDITSGAFDYNSVLRRVARQLTNSGLRTIDYASGRTNRCDVAARRAVMTGISKLTSTITQQNAAKLGTKYYEVEWHAGARPEHMEWQGKVYHEDDLRRICGLGDPLGLCGINCYHTYYPFIPGVSERNYTDEWLAEMNAQELTPVSYRGKEYTRYEAEQRQRYLETCIRAQRERVSLLKTGKADPDEIVIQQCRYQAMLDEYRKFSKAVKLPTQAERIYTGSTTGRIAPTQKVYARYQAEQMAKAAKTSIKQTSQTKTAGGTTKFLKTGGEDGAKETTETKVLIKYDVAETNELAKKYLKETLGLDASFEYRSMNVDVANMFNREIAAAYNTFGNLHNAGVLNEIFVITGKQDYVAMYQGATKIIGVVKPRVSGKNAIARMEREAKSEHATGVWSTDASAHAIRHELGHAVEKMLLTPEKEARIEAFRIELCKKCGIIEWIGEATQETPAETLKAWAKAAGEELSYYGLKTTSEMIAESTAEFLNGNPRSAALKVIDILTSED